MQPVFHRNTCSPAGQAGAQPACTAGSDDVKVMHSSPAVALPTQPCAKRWGAPRASLVSQEEALVAADGLVVVDGCTNSILVAVPHQLGHLGLCQPILLVALQGANTVFTKSSDHEGKRQLADMSSDPLLRCLQVGKGSSNLELYQPCKFGAGLWGERAYDNDNFRESVYETRQCKCLSFCKQAADAEPTPGTAIAQVLDAAHSAPQLHHHATLSAVVSNVEQHVR